MHGKAFAQNGVRGEFGYCRQALPKPAASVRAERDDRLAGKIVALEESRDRHRYRCPPVGVAQQDLLVFSDACGRVLDLRPRLPVLILLRLHEHSVVACRIGVNEHYFEQIGAGLLHT